MLFLVNFVVWLGEGELGLGATGWGLVELLGRHLLGPQVADFDDDPLWVLLAELDGRRPGYGSSAGPGPTAAIRLPQEWLKRWPLPGASFVAYLDLRHLVITEEQTGVVVADVPCGADRYHEVSQIELAYLQGSDIKMAPGPWTTKMPMMDRLGYVVGNFVEWLLASRGIGIGALTSPGRVYASATHVDVVLNLEDVDMRARRAGLDRDPGWVPAMGRIVLFHFLDEGLLWP